MKTRLTVAYIGNIVDTIATLHLSKLGCYELNPIMRHLLDWPVVFVLVKLTAMTAVCLFLWKNREDTHAMPLAAFAAVVYGGIAVYYGVLLTII